MVHRRLTWAKGALRASASKLKRTQPQSIAAASRHSSRPYASVHLEERGESLSYPRGGKESGAGRKSAQGFHRLEKQLKLANWQFPKGNEFKFVPFYHLRGLLTVVRESSRNPSKLEDKERIRAKTWAESKDRLELGDRQMPTLAGPPRTNFEAYWYLPLRYGLPPSSTLRRRPTTN
jgi:hypothetical protein